MWSDAEEFLEFLDLAADGKMSAQRKLLEGLLSSEYSDDGRVRNLAATAKRRVAAECCFFDDSDVDYEKWLPYRTWANQLDENDTVITFNYDRVVEAAAERVGRPIDLCLNASFRREGAARLLKLHGSVDWKTNEQGVVSQQPVPDFAVGCQDSEITLASPGPSKARFTEQMKDLWALAHQAIASAPTVIFVGYRFPPTDAIARERILGWLSENGHTPLNVHTVLGPSRDAATLRLEALLEHAIRRGGRRLRTEPLAGEHPARYYGLGIHPLFAEDFLGRVTGDALKVE